MQKIKKSILYIYVDEQVNLTEDYKPQIADQYKAYLSSMEKEDSVTTANAYCQFDEKVRRRFKTYFRKVLLSSRHVCC